MRTFEIESISPEGAELDESRLAWISGGKPKGQKVGEETGCIPDHGGSIRADEPKWG